MPGPIYGRLPSSCQSLLLLSIFWAFFFGGVDFVGGSKNVVFFSPGESIVEKKAEGEGGL